MDKQARREALREYKERNPSLGVFVVRCAASGEAWVGASRNLPQQQNRVWFALRTGGHPNRATQAAWTAHGEAAFSFEALEVVDAEGLSRQSVEARLKDREGHWREALGAARLVG